LLQKRNGEQIFLRSRPPLSNPNWRNLRNWTELERMKKMADEAKASSTLFKCQLDDTKDLHEAEMQYLQKQLDAASESELKVMQVANDAQANNVSFQSPNWTKHRKWMRWKHRR